MAELAMMVAGSVLEKLGSVAKDEISLAWGMKKDLKKLEEKTWLVRSVLNDAEKKQARNKDAEKKKQLRAWLVRLKDVFNDTVDVLDEFDCEALRRQVVREYGSVGTKVRRFFSSDNPIAFRFSIAHKVKEVRERLDEIVENMAQFNLISSQLSGHEEQSHVIDSERSDRMTHSFVKASDVIGRDSEKAQIIDMLLRQDDPNSEDNLSVIPIVGIGGLGKTTLAKSVYNDDRLDGSFDLKLWVCVSLDFAVTRLVREIFREILRETKAKEDISNMSIQQLQTSLRSNLEGKKFLLVLDDVWNEERHKWLELSELLTVGAKGSKVIVTTRTKLVSEKMTTTPPHELKGLSEEHCLSLFFKCAFGDEKQVVRYPELEGIGKVIVRKCGGVPLALKTLGSLLYNTQAETDWIRVRDNEIWELEREDGQILPALRLSYNDMSPCLKQCFAYCSTFPEDAEMNSFKLISIWMALGILQSANEEIELEEIGQLQFKELCSRAFFQCDDDSDDEDTNYGLPYHGCSMHDLIHGLAHSITESECHIIKSGTENIPDSVRHLRIIVNRNDLTVLKNYYKLRSIYIDCTAAKECNFDELFLSTCIKQLRCLRVFDLKGLSFEVLPSSIGTLKHLRYLNLSENQKIKRLPNSICKLQNLQTLLFGECQELEELPRGIRRLVSLRTLAVTTKQEYFPENGIGCLKSLRTLFIYKCKNLRSLPHDMRNCTSLHTLYIANCVQLDLATRSYEVVNKLSLQLLVVCSLPRMTALPHWLKGASHTLKHLLIEECKQLVALPEWLPDLVSLQYLVIKECEELLGLPDGMECLAALTHLEIEDCKQLHLTSGRDGPAMHLKLQTVKIEDLPQAMALPNWLRAAHTLQHLHIRNCPNLVALPEWLPNLVSLQKLVIKECEELLGLPDGMECLTALTHLEIEDCKQLHLTSGRDGPAMHLKLQTVKIEDLPQAMALPNWLRAAHTLQHLYITNCPNLVALPEWLLDLTSLKSIFIRGCPRLSSLPEGMSHLTSLTHLCIRDCPELDALPEWLPYLTSLKSIEISKCPRLLSLPEGMSRLTSLTDLEITNTSAAFYERYEHEIGKDWANIAHIPKVYIYCSFPSSDSSPESSDDDKEANEVKGD